MPNPLILHAPSEGEGLALPLGLAGYPTEADGVPIHYRKVKVARCGDWTHRGTGERVPITAERVDEWVRNTKALSAAGVKPFVPGQHRDTFNAADNFGYVADLAREGDDLYAVLQLFGDDALKVAALNGRSIYAVADALDAKGKCYPGESIAHIALVPNPALPDLGGTIRIAASAGGVITSKVFQLHCGTGDGGFKAGNTCAKGGGGGGEKDILEKVKEARAKNIIWKGQDGYFHMGDFRHKSPVEVWKLATMNGTREAEYTHVDAKEEVQRFKDSKSGFRTADAKRRSRARQFSLSGDTPMTEQQLDSIRELIGADDVTDETAIPLLVEWGNKQKASGEKVTALSADKTRLETELKAAKDDVAAKTLALSANAPTAPDGWQLSLLLDNFKNKREQAIASGAISEAGMNAIDAPVMPGGKPNGVVLSLSGDGVAARPFYARLCEIIAGNPGVKTNNQVERAQSALKLSANSDDLLAHMTPEERRTYAAQCMGVSPTAKSA